MDHQDHVNLLRGGVAGPGGVWADLGSGTGAFTAALAELIGPQGEIYSIDRDGRALRTQERSMNARFPERPPGSVRYLQADYTRQMALPPLDGLVMANALHFQREKESVVRLVSSYLRPGGCMVLVEYNTDYGNMWVPHPLSYQRWEELARATGFLQTRLLATVPSRFLGEVYSALSC